MRCSVFILGISMLLAASSCRSSKKRNNPCRSNVICTEMFAMVTINIKDTTGEGVKLDSAYTIRKSTNEKIHHEQTTFIDGSYIVLDDNYHKKFVNTNDSFYFYGFLNGTQVVNEGYLITSDCCHIRKTGGNTDVTLK